MYAEAMDAYGKALCINPRSTDAHLRKGMALYRLGRYAQATEAYRQAIATSPDCPVCYNKLGSVLIIQGEYGRAIETFREELRLDPLSGEVHFNIGLLDVQTMHTDIQNEDGESYHLEGQNLLAARVSRDIFEQSYVGAMFTNGNPAGTGTTTSLERMPGSPHPSSRGTRISAWTFF
jgi:tetratricopeptide (TPR) repeat protein